MKRKNPLNELEYIPFLSVYDYGHSNVDEATYKAYGQYSQIVFVLKSDLENWRKDGSRLMGTFPATTRGYEQTEQVKKDYCGYPKFNFGLYYDPDKLLFMDDVISYGHGRKKFTEIRTARNFLNKKYE